MPAWRDPAWHSGAAWPLGRTRRVLKLSFQAHKVLVNSIALTLSKNTLARYKYRYVASGCHWRQDTDPDPSDPYVFGPTESVSISQRYGSGSFPFLINVLGVLKQCLQNKIWTQNFSQKLNFFDWRWCACGQVRRKIMGKKTFFGILKVKEERSRIQSWIRIRIHESEVRIRGSGSESAPKCNWSPTLFITKPLSIGLCG